MNLDPRTTHTHYTEETSRASGKCPSCGAINPPGAKNCTFCGYTLVDVTQKKVEEGYMDMEEALHGATKFGYDFLHSAAEHAKEANKEFVPEGITPEQQKRNRDKFFTILILGIVGIAVFGIIGIVGMTVIINRFSFAIASGGAEAVDTASKYLTLGSIIVEGILFVGFLACAVGVFVLIRKKKTTTTTLKRKCSSCGGVNPAGARICEYCGASMIDTQQTTSSSFAEMGGKAGEKFTDVVVDMARKVREQQKGTDN